MQWVRRHRHRVILVFSLGAIAAMTFGFLKRIGIDPLGAAVTEEREVEPTEECEAEPFDGLCELEGVTSIQMDGDRALRARYHLVGKSRSFFVERLIRLEERGEAAERRAIEEAPRLTCRGEWMRGPCPSTPFVFGDVP